MVFLILGITALISGILTIFVTARAPVKQGLFRCGIVLILAGVILIPVHIVGKNIYSDKGPVENTIYCESIDVEDAKGGFLDLVDCKRIKYITTDGKIEELTYSTEKVDLVKSDELKIEYTKYDEGIKELRDLFGLDAIETCTVYYNPDM